MNYFEYFIPSKGMTPYFGNSGDKWYPGMLTYDMGRAERIAAAFSARTWLVALKYMKNIACLNDWSIRRYFWDYDLSVGAKMKVVNTMGRILGDADFYRDIRFAPLCRCYMFVNEKKQPVAIIWGHDTAVDKGEKAPPVFTFDFGGQKLEFWDLMETQRTFPAKGGKTDIPAGPFPLFIIGEPGTEEALAKSIAEAKNVSGDITPVTVSAVPINALTAQIKLLNTLSSSLKAAASISLNGVTEKLDLTFKPNTAETRNVNMAKDMAPLKPFNFSFSAQTPGMSPKMGEISGMFTMVKTGGKDWSGVQEIRTAEGAGVKIRADESALHLSLRVPKSFAGARPTLLLDAYVKDNSWSDFKTKTQDIYVFELSSQTNGAVTAFCHAVPCVQADSGEWTPKAGRADSKITGHVSSDTNGEELWELSIPAASVMPLKFEKGERFGFNLVIKRDELLSSFAPVKDYQDAKQPGKFKLALALTH
jgi:hypothetical protein